NTQASLQWRDLRRQRKGEHRKLPHRCDMLHKEKSGKKKEQTPEHMERHWMAEERRHTHTDGEDERKRRRTVKGE
ncbi:hypothetical protein HYW84_03990, partial [Candidatus Peregrinibacteria bacterium]|nr:hypothetical protein [Candidatus Peregrinibacteria bacterium]